jgi:hypothetical protein
MNNSWDIEPISVHLLCSLRHEVEQRSMTERGDVLDGNEVSRPAKLNFSQLERRYGCLLNQVRLHQAYVFGIAHRNGPGNGHAVPFGIKINQAARIRNQKTSSACGMI